MMGFRKLVALAAIAMVAFGLMSCERKITRVETVSGPLSCADCHDASDLITAKRTQWEESLHGTGESFARGTSAGCAGCHSGSAFPLMVEAGLNPGSVSTGDPDPTRQDCRTCHMIHDTFTMQDFALRTTAPVAMYAVSGAIYDGGAGNLCVNCHQPRRDAPVAVGGTVTGISEHWGPHHGPQSAMLLGRAGAGPTGTQHGHYAIENTCVDCHMGDGDNHTFEPVLAKCRECHTSATNFDVNGVQTEIAALGDSLGAKLLALGLINENSADGHPIVSSAPEAQGYALWNWVYVMHEDKSLGVHNYAYAKALLEAGIAALPEPAPQPIP